MLNTRFYNAFAQVLCQIEALLAALSEDLLHYRLLQRALGKLRTEFMKDKIFPALSLPSLTWEALGEAPDDPRLAILNAAHLLFYAFLDLTDDVEDHELTDPLWQQLGEPLAINTGTSLLFLSQLMLERLLAYQVTLPTAYALQRRFSRAGWQLTIGQHRDLSSHRARLSPADVLQTHRLKTGTSVALYLETPALLAETPEAPQHLLNQLGQQLGLIVQLQGDWYNLLDTWSSDFSNHCQSYPLVCLCHMMCPADQTLWSALQPRAHQDQATHDLMRYLLARYQVHLPVQSTLNQALTEVDALLESLRQQGCQTQGLEHFIQPLAKPLPPAKG